MVTYFWFAWLQGTNEEYTVSFFKPLAKQKMVRSLVLLFAHHGSVIYKFGLIGSRRDRTKFALLFAFELAKA